MRSNLKGWQQTPRWRSISRYEHDAKAGVGALSPHNTGHSLEVSSRWLRSDQYCLFEPQIDSQKVHVWPFDAATPLELRMIQEELPASSTRALLAIKTYLKMILILLVNQYASYASRLDSSRRQQRAMERLQNFFGYLPAHVGDVIRAPEAARMCDLSEAEFSTYLRQLTGRSFRSYLNYYRVERAQAALANTNHPLSEIAQEMGFCDQSYFGAVFHKFTGMTPLAYRHRHRIMPEHISAVRSM